MADERTVHSLLGTIRETDSVAAVHVPDGPALSHSMVGLKRWLMQSHLCERVWTGRVRREGRFRPGGGDQVEDDWQGLAGGVVVHDRADMTFTLPPEHAAALKRVVGGPTPGPALTRPSDGARRWG